MKLRIDKAADALYLRLDDSLIVESEEVSPGVVLDYNELNEVVGVEILYLSKRSSDWTFPPCKSRLPDLPCAGQRQLTWRTITADRCILPPYHPVARGPL